MSVDAAAGHRRVEPCRRFTLLDGMILVGGAAVGFAGARAGLEEYYDYWFIEAHQFAGFTLMLASVLVLILRLRKPRPTLRRIARQPGAVACAAVVAVQVEGTINSLISDSITEEWGRFSRLDSAIWALLCDFVPTMVMVVPICWVLLILLRRHRPERGWIDRSGRVVGWAWIVWSLVAPVLFWLSTYYLMNGAVRSIM